MDGQQPEGLMDVEWGGEGMEKRWMDRWTWAAHPTVWDTLVSPHSSSPPFPIPPRHGSGQD